MKSNSDILAAIRAAGLTVEQFLTLYNYSKGNIGRIEYIVIHYVGATGDAMANARYYASTYVGASAHLYVGFKGQIVQSVECQNIAWAVGTNNGYRHPRCRNSNSISIEMCVRNPHGSVSRTDKDAGWYFEQATIEATQRLVRVLMDVLNIPIGNVLRHHDVTGKMCPAPYCNGQMEWADFMAGLAEKGNDDMTQEQFNTMLAEHDKQMAAQPVSAWAASAWEAATKAGIFDGSQPRGPLTREQAAVVMQRLGKL